MKRFLIFLLLVVTTSWADVPYIKSTFYTPSPPFTSKKDGEFGARFFNATGESIIITALGRYCLPGNNQVHTLTLYTEYHEILARVTVNLAGKTADTFVYTDLPTPVAVPPGYFYLLSTESSTGDTYYDAFSRLFVKTADIATAEGGYWNVTTESLASVGGYPDRCSGPVNFKYSAPLHTWTKSGNTYTTDGTYYQLVSAIQDANEGDVVQVPDGTYTWGGGGTTLTLKAGVTISGASMAGTIINMAPDSPTGFGASLIILNDRSVVRQMTFNGPDAANCPLLRTAQGANDWRVSEIAYNQFTGRSSYFINIAKGTRGLVDKCIITGGAGNSELIFIRGSDDSWDVDSSLGTENNIFIEDNVWNGTGYICDANSNARAVVRYNTINGSIKVDGHGVWSNGGPQRGVRHMEIYNNHWNVAAGNYAAIEIRGGGGRIFNNTSAAANNANTTWFFLTEYGVFNNNGAFTDYQTPADYPIRDQIGRGRYATPGDFLTATSEPMYLWGNLRGGSQWPLSLKAIPQASIDRYRAQTGNPTATFTWEDIVKADRDYFQDVASFDGSTGVGVGTKAQMLAITPTKTGVGFWVTDEGDWNFYLHKTAPNTSGQLYTWNGTAWVLTYVPYTYPHPSRAPKGPSPATLTE